MSWRSANTSFKLKFALYLGISLYLALSQCHISDAQGIYELSYGQDVLPPVTPQPVTTTTKKSSFFKGIKKWFKGESSSTTTSTTPSTIQVNAPLGPTHSQSNPLSTPKPASQIPSQNPTRQTPPPSGGSSNRDFVNSNMQSGSPTRSPLQVPPSSSNIGTTGQNMHALSGANQPPTNRDFVNPNTRPSSLPPSSIPVTPSTPLSGLPTTPRNAALQPPRAPANGFGGNLPPNQGIPPFSSNVHGNSGTASHPQSPVNRDYVNPNARPTNPPTNSPAQPSGTSSIGGQTPPRRDFVNANIGPGTRVTPSPSENPAQPSGTRRDFVNTSPRPASSSIPQPAGATNPWGNIPQTPSAQRDVVNPNINRNHPQQNDKNFPPLPSPGRPSSPTHQSGRPGSPQQQSNSNPSSPTGVSFIPPQPSSGRSTTPKPTELATDEEITTLTEALFTKDVNNQNRHITVNYQGKTRSSETTDEAPNPLLQVSDEALQSPTIAKMRPLFNNYELDTTVNEHVTPLERREENELLDAVLATSVMRHAMLFLQNKGIVTPDPKTHRDLLKTVWFTLYSRGGGRIGSSAFEHVFLSEVKNGTITGLHNWVYYFEEEHLGHIDYKGYIKKLELGNKGSIVKFRFNFNGIEKPVNSMFIGTSPELEMALYTVCFQMRPNRDCPISLNANRFTIQTYTFRYRGKNLIGSAYPEI